MKKNLLIIFLILVSMKAFSQENMFTVSGGYSFSNIEAKDIKGTGWRINGLYELNPNGRQFCTWIFIRLYKTFCIRRCWFTNH